MKIICIDDHSMRMINIRDGNWQGFLGTDIECVIDLGKEIEVTEIGANFLHKQLSWILTPKEVVFQTSVDGITWKNWGTVISKVDAKNKETILETFSKENPAETVRYVKLFAKNLDQLPEWHEFYKGKSWLFVDEIFVN